MFGRLLKVTWGVHDWLASARATQVFWTEWGRAVSDKSLKPYRKLLATQRGDEILMM